jgi:hypothetical protein
VRERRQRDREHEQEKAVESERRELREQRGESDSKTEREL